MPEILTKHPDIVMKVLKSQGAQCGTGAKPKILTKCPAENFCTLTGGELCVYGTSDVGKMTQLSLQDLCRTSSAPVSTHEEMPALPPASHPPQEVVAGIPIAVALVSVGLFAIVRHR